MIAFHLALLISPPAYQARTISIPAASPRYSLTVKLTPSADSSDDRLLGSAIVTLKLRSTGKDVQTIRVPKIAILPDHKALSVAIGGKSPSDYGATYSFVFEDFNFDGRQDLAICTGMDGSYGAPTYDVLLWNPKSGKFVKNATLTSLASEHLGLFVTDSAKRQLNVFDKDGAAWHKTSTYAWRRGVPTLVKSEVDDARGDQEIITTKTLVGKSWRTHETRHKNPGGNG